MNNLVRDELFNKASQAIDMKDLYHADKFISELKRERVDSVSIDLLEVRCLTEKHLLNRALILLNSILDKEQNNQEVYLYRGKIYMNMGQRELGYTDLKQAYNIDKDNIEIKYFLGRASVSCGKYEEAREIYKDLYHYSKDEQVFGLFETVNNYIVDKISSKDSDLDDDDKLNIAKSYYYLSDINKAAEFMKMVDNIEALKDGEIIYSNILRTQKNYQMALLYINKAIEKYSDDPRVYFYKAMLMEDQRKFGEAINYYNEAMNKDKYYKPAYNRLAKLLIVRGQYDKALEISNKATEFNYDYDLTLNNKGKALFYLGQYEEALKCFNESIKIYPRCIDGYVNKSMFYRTHNNINEGFEVCDKAIELGYQDDKLAIEKAILFLIVEDYELALDWIEWAIEYNNDNVFAHFVRSICNSKLNRFQDATNEIEEIIIKEPEDIMAYCAKIFIYIEMGKNEDELLDIVRNYDHNRQKYDHIKISDFMKQIEYDNSELKLDYVIRAVISVLEKISKREEN